VRRNHLSARADDRGTPKPTETAPPEPEPPREAPVWEGTCTVTFPKCLLRCRPMLPSLRQLSLAILVLLSSPAGAGESLFVFIPRADSPGNDYSRIEHLTFDECAHSCDVDTKCNAFTYNQLNDECLLKTAVNQWVQFYAWSITGVKLSQGLQNE
jgi:hypothetical protein